MVEEGEVNVRVGVASILEDANAQMQHGLVANFGVKNLGHPAVFESEIDVSDNELLISTLEKARKEVSLGTESPTTTLKCIAKRLRPNGRTYVRCQNFAIKCNQYCPLHLQVS